MKTFSFYWHDELEAALKEAAEKNGIYHMSLTSEGEKQAVISAVNQGIDSHLEACFTPDLGDFYGHGQRSFVAQGDTVVHTNTLECRVSPKSLVVLVRRLMEMDENEDQIEGRNEGPMSLASSIFASLDIEVV